MFGTIPLYFVIAIIAGIIVAGIAVGFCSCWLCKQCYLCYEKKHEARERRQRRQRRRRRNRNHYYNDDDDDVFDDDIYHSEQDTRGYARRQRPRRQTYDAPRRNSTGAIIASPSPDNDEYHVEDERGPSRGSRGKSRETVSDDEKHVQGRSTRARQHTPKHPDGEEKEKKGCALCCYYCCCCCDSLDDEYYYDSDDEESEYDDRPNRSNDGPDKRVTSARSIHVAAAAVASNSDPNTANENRSETANKNSKKHVQSQKNTTDRDKHDKLEKKEERANKKEKHANKKNEKLREEKAKKKEKEKTNNNGSVCCAGCVIPSDDSEYEDSENEDSEVNEQEEGDDIRRSPNKMDKTTGVVAASVGRQKREKSSRSRLKSKKTNKNKTDKKQKVNNDSKTSKKNYTSNQKVVCCCLGYESDDEYYEDSDEECSDEESYDSDSLETHRKNGALAIPGAKAKGKAEKTTKTNSKSTKASHGQKTNTQKKPKPNKACKSCFLFRIKCVGCKNCCKKKQHDEEYSDDSSDYYIDDSDSDDYDHHESRNGDNGKALASKPNEKKAAMPPVLVVAAANGKSEQHSKIQSDRQIHNAPVSNPRNDRQINNIPGKNNGQQINNNRKYENANTGNSKESTSQASKKQVEKSQLTKKEAVISYMDAKYGSPEVAEDVKGNSASDKPNSTKTASTEIRSTDDIDSISISSTGKGEFDQDNGRPSNNPSNYKRAKTPEPVLLTTKTVEKRNAAISALFASSNTTTQSNNASSNGPSNKTVTQSSQSSNGAYSNDSIVDIDVPASPEKTREERKAERKAKKNEKNHAVMALLSGSMYSKKNNSNADNTNDTASQPITQQNSNRQEHNYQPSGSAPTNQTQRINGIPAIAAATAVDQSRGANVGQNNGTGSTNNGANTNAKLSNQSTSTSYANQANSDEGVPNQSTLTSSTNQANSDGNTSNQPKTASDGKPLPKVGLKLRGRKDWKAAVTLAVAKEQPMPNLKTDWDIMGGGPKKESDKNNPTSKLAATVSALMAKAHFAKSKQARKNEPAWDLLEGKPKHLQTEEASPKPPTRKSRSLNTLFENENDLFSVELPTKRQKKRPDDFDWDDASSFDRGSNYSARTSQPSILMDDSHPVTQSVFQIGPSRRTSITNIRY